MHDKSCQGSSVRQRAVRGERLKDHLIIQYIIIILYISQIQHVGNLLYWYMLSNRIYDQKIEHFKINNVVLTYFLFSIWKVGFGWTISAPRTDEVTILTKKGIENLLTQSISEWSKFIYRISDPRRKSGGAANLNVGVEGSWNRTRGCHQSWARDNLFSVHDNDDAAT